LSRPRQTVGADEYSRTGASRDEKSGSGKTMDEGSGPGPAGQGRDTKGPKGGADKNSKNGMLSDKTSWAMTRSRR